MSWTQIRIFSAVAACAIAAAACDRKEAPKAQLDVVKVARSTLLTNAPLAIGDEEGIFEGEGIRLEYIQVPGVTTQSLPALQQGDIDVLSAAISIGLINGVGSGATFRIVADRGYVDPKGCEPFGIIGRRSLFAGKTVNADLLRGLRVSTNEVGQSGYILSNYLKRFGLTLGDMKLVRLPPTVEPEAMEVGNVDIVTRGDPHFYNMMSRGHILLAGARDAVPESHLAVLLYGPTFLGEKREVGMRFMKAYLAAVRRYNEGPTPHNVDIVSRRLGMEADALKRMCWPTTRADGRINAQTLIDYQKWAVESGNLAKVISTEQLIDTTFAASARK
jgi:NitT/TauT family transport system substrate-binding protein